MINPGLSGTKRCVSIADNDVRLRLNDVWLRHNDVLAWLTIMVQSRYAALLLYYKVAFGDFIPKFLRSKTSFDRRSTSFMQRITSFVCKTTSLFCFDGDSPTNQNLKLSFKKGNLKNHENN